MPPYFQVLESDHQHSSWRLNKCVDKNMASSDIQARLRFMKRAEIYKTEKPWGLNYGFDNWPTGIARGNFVREDVEDILINDLRGRENQFTFKRHGFAVVEMHSSMTYEDFSSPKKVEEIYCAELGSCLLEYLGATHVQIFDAQVSFLSPITNILLIRS